MKCTGLYGKHNRYYAARRKTKHFLCSCLYRESLYTSTFIPTKAHYILYIYEDGHLCPEYVGETMVHKEF
jgi:hypothetical protein